MYTSCPECGTVFRISTNDLRVAEGHVRCGHCSATFNAVAPLSDEPPRSATRVSPTEPESLTPPVDVAGAAHGDDTLEFNIPEDSWSNFFTGDVLSRGRQEPVIAEMPAEPVDLPATDPESTDAPPEPPPPEVDDGDWQALLDEVQDDNAATDSVYVIETDPPEDVPEDVPAQTPWDEPALEATRTPAPLPVDFMANLALDRTAADFEVPGSGVDPDDGQTTPETPDEPATHQPFAWTPPEPVATVEPRRRWVYAAGTALLAVALIIQLLHQRRDELATNPAFTEALQRVYGALEIPLWPAWNLQAYEIRNYEAIADRSSRGALDILARIAVVGDDRVGLPLVRVTLTDRFGQPLGSRVFEPDEYLGKNSRPREPVSPGTLIPVEISLKDPGTDAQGFDVDICLMNQRDGMTCQSEREPFSR
ncbi:MAG: DUF3426 domain-containing protein [Chromatiales bacterium]|nr:MAG: DUF3426 domain-containing protein [Chromatiales bacterium]